MAIANFLCNQPKVSTVYYPGLETHPGHAVAKSQMNGFGGVLSFSIDGSFEYVRKLLKSLKLAHLAATLGSVSTLAGPPRTTSHVELTEDQRRALGIPEGLIRYSVGIENPEDLLEDLSQAISSL